MSTPAQPVPTNLPVVPGHAGPLIDLTPASINRVLHVFGVASAERTRRGDGSEGEFKDFPRKTEWQSLSGKIAEQVGEPAQNQRRQTDERLALAEIDDRLDHLEDALLAFLHGRTPGQADNSKENDGPAPDMLTVCLSLLEELRKKFFTATIPAHHRLRDFPRFFALALETIQAGIAAGYVGNDGVAFAVPFLEHARRYLVSAMEQAFHERYREVNWHLGGAHSELAYIYDERRQESLTEWIKLSSETAPDLEKAGLFLEDAVARAYVSALPLAMAFQALGIVLLESDGLSVERYKAEILPPVRPENASISRLLLPAAIARYCSTARKHRKTRAYNKETIKKVSADLPSRMTTTYISTLGKSTALKYATAAAGSTFLGVVAPIILALMEILWPGEPAVTMAEVQAEIDKRIADSLGKEERDKINKNLETVGSNYAKTFIIFNSKPASKTRIESWLRLLESTHELELALCNPSNNIYYELYPYFAMFMEMRQNVLSGAMLCAVEDEELSDAGKDEMIEELLEDTKQFYNRCYFYLQNLVKSAFEYMYYVHIYVESWYVPIAYKDNQALDGISGYRFSKECRTDMYSDAGWYLASHIGSMVDDRGRFFVALNTGIHNLCLQYDMAITTFNESGLLNEKFPTAIDNIFKNELVSDRYCYHVGGHLDAAKKLGSNDNQQAIWYNMHLFGTNGWHQENPTTWDGLVDIEYDTFDAGSHRKISIGVGDYPDLWLLMKNNGIDIDATRHGFFNFSIPYGFRVDLYESKGWAGNFVRYPISPDDGRDPAHTNWSVHLAKSMKIYVDMPCYFKVPSVSRFTDDIAHRKENAPLIVRKD